jgi:hypothetical protein
MDFARYNALGLYLHPALGKDNPVEFPGNHHVISLNLPFHASPFAEDQTVAGDYVSFYMRVDAKHPGGFERPLEANTFVKEAGKFLLLRVLAAFFRSPLHGVPSHAEIRFCGNTILPEQGKFEAKNQASVT